MPTHAEVIERLIWELDEARNEVRRWQQEFKSYAVHADARCEHFGKCQCGLQALLDEIGLKEEGE